jgi:hypothetical protein
VPILIKHLSSAAYEWGSNLDTTMTFLEFTICKEKVICILFGAKIIFILTDDVKNKIDLLYFIIIIIQCFISKFDVRRMNT